MDKIKALKQSKGNFDALMSVSKKGVADMKWWLHNLDDSYNDICHPPVDITLYSDASLMDWGAAMNDTSTGGRWSPSEAENHINCLEFLAALFAIQCFQSSLSGKHVKIMIDNTTAVSVIGELKQPRRQRWGRRHVKNEFIFYQRNSRLSTSVQCANGCKNLFKLNMQRQPSIANRNTKK